ncbi:AAA family ATPase [Cupriavidus taiwanensis]|uniref:ATPase AAA-2 domain protein n=1 Tax=Cupriavidus taiwanensis TaxID=164546 RepID=A0A7Z7JIK2_9BURK|nr:AAA family ATPase [Cupriavidus taiwanensis]SOZ19201.1 ATPase AAA-2 domain protein [Cupriavidus taiwanensis]SOZ97235.1 ATPase AAA-2 domain protein [Cupriavidus taiwanensis]SPC26128.1 ATPase AAA-2 domain protein [Cupriavidus taiwanensis]SPD37741.1 ATPase AAA-2 domain protein [Cupriavidus taiwanensis]
MSAYVKPRWMRDLLRFLPLKSQFVLSGNIRDLQACEVAPGIVTAQSLTAALSDNLREAGYAQVVVWDPISGFTVSEGRTGLVEPAEDTLRSLGLSPVDAAVPGGIDMLAATFERLVSLAGEPVALVVDFASRLTIRPETLSASEHNLFTRALVLAHLAKPRPAGAQRRPFFNTILWVVDKEGDLPDWLLIDNPRVRHIPVSKPDSASRRALSGALLRGVPGAQEAAPDVLAQADAAFVDGSEGLLLADMNAIATLARVENVPVVKIADAVRRYKVGVTEDPWLQIDREKIQKAEAFVRNRVKGQAHAVTHMLDLVKRAMTGVGSQRKGSRPRGIAFLAGPTGVGKTELAKTVTSLLFGDESAYIRFDMSEFSAEHADQRLIGAPPGYVGYDVGGELTNAIRERPFSVVLFDEVEKAHPRILDKFLQILDDGVLTSGRGDRVYFSEALIIFTSNLGIYRQDDTGERIANVQPGDAFETIQERVLAEIQRHFKLVLNRPEILNRIGENIIVFDFIRDDVGDEIFKQMVRAVLDDIAGQGITIELESETLAALRKRCLHDLSNGGRGIRNQIEAHLINPLARGLFDQNAKVGDHFVLTGLASGQLEVQRQ